MLISPLGASAGRIPRLPTESGSYTILGRIIAPFPSMDTIGG
jgi:hypothetical protein